MDTFQKLKKRCVKYAFQGQVLLTGGSAGAQQPLLSQLFDPSTNSLGSFFNTAFKVAIALGAMLAVLRLGYAGIIYLTTDVVGLKGNAREIISRTIMGLLLLLAIWLILNQINPDILNLNILRNFQSSSQTTGGGTTAGTRPAIDVEFPDLNQGR